MDFVSTCTIPLEEYNRLKKLEADHEVLKTKYASAQDVIMTFCKPFTTLTNSEEAVNKFKKAIEENKFSAHINEINQMHSFEDPISKKTSLTLSIILDGEFYRK